jgi:hypothetical protein
LREEVECQREPDQVQSSPSLILPSVSLAPPTSTTPLNVNIGSTHGGNETGTLKRQARGLPGSAPATKHRVSNDYYSSSSVVQNVTSASTNSGDTSTPTPNEQLNLSTSVPTNPTSKSSSQSRRDNSPNLYQTSAFYSTASTSAAPPPQYLIDLHSAAPAIPYHPHPPLKRWPNDYTVSELTAGFQAMELLISQSPDGSAMTQRRAFERVFGSRYVKSTVCRHRGVWRKAHRAIRDEFEAMGDNEHGCWGEFVRRVEGRPPGKVGRGAGLPGH